MGLSKYLEPPVGKVFNHWEVIGYSHYKNEHHWKVKCVLCGDLHIRRASQVVLGRSKSCRTCSAKMREEDKSPYWSGVGPISSQYVTRMAYRGKEVTVTTEDLYEIWEKQGGCCALSGVQLVPTFKSAEVRHLLIG